MHPSIRHAPDPANPGWWTWDVEGETRYSHSLGPLIVRRGDDGRGRCRMLPRPDHSNILDVMHGGALLTFIDMAMFAGGHMAGLSDTGGVTLDCNVQFIGQAEIGAPIEAAVELLRETGRLAFLRGTVEQEGRMIAAFSGTIRKIGPR